MIGTRIGGMFIKEYADEKPYLIKKHSILLAKYTSFVHKKADMFRYRLFAVFWDDVKQSSC